MTGYKPVFAATLLSLTALLFGTAAQAAPELKASATEVMVGETVQIDALSGSSMLPVYAKEWNVSSQFSLISASRTGARVKALSAGIGTVAANVNMKDLTVTIKVIAPEPVAAAPVAAPVATPVAPVQEVVAAPPVQKLSACQQEMVDRKREIAQDFNEARYDDARAKLLDMQKAWLNDSRWADALLGAIDKLAPLAAGTPAAR